MKVSVQYAESRLTELVPTSEKDATEKAGSSEERLSVAQAAKKRGLWGAGKGEIWMADDWDSQKTNEEIAGLFNDGPIFPSDSGS